MEPKLFCFLLMFCVIPDDSCANKQWLIDVPSKITALQGSCVVFPCKYTHPNAKKPVKKWGGFWKTGNKTVSTNIPKWKLTNEFHKRTRFLGNLGHGNCTMLLNSVRTTDVGPFYFRIEISHYRPYTFSKNTVSIDVIPSPKPPSLTVQVRDEVIATCSVYHSCPYVPPRITWSHFGMRKSMSVQGNKWMWRTQSVLQFVPVSSDFNQPLKCTAAYTGGKKAENSIILVK